jgi:hypothetical protein
MTVCPDEATLLAVAMGETDAATRAHVARCAACAPRLEQLRTDLHALRGVLVDAPLPPALRRGAPAPRAAWLSGVVPPLAALGLAAVVLLAIVWPRAMPRAAQTPQPQLDRLTADVSAALFATHDRLDPAEPLADHAYIAAALNGGWPCDSRYGDACSYDDLLDQ